MKSSFTLYFSFYLMHQQSEIAKRRHLEQQVGELKEKVEQQAEVTMKKGAPRKAYGNHWKSAHDNSSTTGKRR